MFIYTWLYVLCFVSICWNIYSHVKSQLNVFFQYHIKNVSLDLKLTIMLENIQNRKNKYWICDIFFFFSCVASLIKYLTACASNLYHVSSPSFLQTLAPQEAGSSLRSSSPAPSAWRCLWSPSPRPADTASARPACRAIGTTARSSSAPCARRPTPKSPRWASTGSWLRSPPSSRGWSCPEEPGEVGPYHGDPRWTWARTRARGAPQGRTLGSSPGLGMFPATPASGGS